MKTLSKKRIVLLSLGAAMLVVMGWIFYPTYTAPVQAETTYQPQPGEVTYGYMSDTKLHYFRDERTDLCFAIHRGTDFSGEIANVPCTDKVQALLEK